MKVYVRTLWGTDQHGWGNNEERREALRKHLNEWGFYVLTGPTGALDVYAIEDTEPVDIRCAKKGVEIARKAWYKMTGGANA